MTIGFLASRKGYLKVAGALIAEAVRRGHQVVLFSDPAERKPGEAVTAEDFAAWPAAPVVPHRRGEPLLPLLEARSVRALVAPSLYLLVKALGLDTEVRAMRAAGVRLYSLDYAFETVTSDPSGYRVLDTTFYQSEFQRRLHWNEHKEDFVGIRQGVDLQARSAVCGSTMMDQLALVGDRAAVRRKYGLPSDRSIVLLMSLKMAVPEPWRRLVWGGGTSAWRAVKALGTGHAVLVPEIWKGNGYRALAEALRRFCRDNGAALVMKSRAKNQDPAFLRALADVFVERDEDVFPYNSIELMAVADLCVHFQSGAVLEAAFCGVPSLSIRIPHPYSPATLPAYRESFSGEPGTLQNFPGVVWSADHAAAAGFLAGKKVGDLKVDPEARRVYVERYLGFDDTRSSARVLDVIERQAGQPLA